jgi:hypothetical protein
MAQTRHERATLRLIEIATSGIPMKASLSPQHQLQTMYLAHAAHSGLCTPTSAHLCSMLTLMLLLDMGITHPISQLREATAGRVVNGGDSQGTVTATSSRIDSCFNWKEGAHGQ